MAFTIAAMDTFSPFFDFELFSVCGIPSITLTGTPDDWRRLRARFRVLAEYDLRWAAALEPVLEQLVETAGGRVDGEFWRSIYKPRSAYFQDQITGWLPRLFPYLDDGSRNEFSSQGWGHPPIQPHRLPRGLSAARVRVDGRRLITLNSGFFGARQLADGSLAPVIAWTVGESTLDQLFDALEKRHHFEPPVTGSSWDGGTVPAELLAFSARFGGGRLYDGELTLLPPSSQARVLLARSEARGVVVAARAGVHFATLRDGRRLVFARERVARGAHDRVVLVGADVRAPFPVIANSMLEFLQRLERETFPPWELKGEWTPA